MVASGAKVRISGKSLAARWLARRDGDLICSKQQDPPSVRNPIGFDGKHIERKVCSPGNQSKSDTTTCVLHTS